MANKAMDNAKTNKADEFYTQLADIEKEVYYYREQFKGKIVLCNCDDPFESNFFKYFAMKFNSFGLKKLIATSYAGSPIVLKQLNFFAGEEPIEQRKIKEPYKIEITEVKDEDGDGEIGLADVKILLEKNRGNLILLKSDSKYNGGDFRSVECIELLKQSDIVVTNPPFSLFREYVAQLIEYDKQFVIIGNVNAVSYKETFKLIKDNKLWLGQSIHSGDREFRVPNSYPLNAATCRIDENGDKFIRVKGVRWFTNLDIPQRHERLILYKNYNEAEYPKYDNYDAINIDKTTDIPCDYKGYMGVPITFLDKYNPEQFEVIALGIVGSIDFLCEKKMEILKEGQPTGKFTINAKGTLYRKYDKDKDIVPPAFKDCETGELYSSIYARVIIKNKEEK